MTEERAATQPPEHRSSARSELTPSGAVPPRPVPSPPTSRARVMQWMGWLAAGLMLVSVIGLVSGQTGGVQVVLWALLAAGVIMLVAVLLVLQESPKRVSDHYEQSMAELNRQFEETAGRDWLTGLMTMGELERVAAREHARSLRYSRPFSLLFVSPVIPRTQGAAEPEHTAASGQDIELAMGQILKQTLRVSDVVARRVDEIGFIAVLPETDEIGAGAAAERLRGEFAADESNSLLGIRSAAVSYPDDGSDLTSLLLLGKSLVANSSG